MAISDVLSDAVAQIADYQQAGDYEDCSHELTALASIMDDFRQRLESRAATDGKPDYRIANVLRRWASWLENPHRPKPSEAHS
jgi:hypothetical protein